MSRPYRPVGVDVLWLVSCRGVVCSITSLTQRASGFTVLGVYSSKMAKKTRSQGGRVTISGMKTVAVDGSSSAAGVLARKTPSRKRVADIKEPRSFTTLKMPEVRAFERLSKKSDDVGLAKLVLRVKKGPRRCRKRGTPSEKQLRWSWVAPQDPKSQPIVFSPVRKIVTSVDGGKERKKVNEFADGAVRAHRWLGVGNLLLRPLQLLVRQPREDHYSWVPRRFVEEGEVDRYFRQLMQEQRRRVQAKGRACCTGCVAPRCGLCSALECEPTLVDPNLNRIVELQSHGERRGRCEHRYCLQEGLGPGQINLEAAPTEEENGRYPYRVYPHAWNNEAPDVGNTSTDSGIGVAVPSSAPTFGAFVRASAMERMASMREQEEESDDLEEQEEDFGGLELSSSDYVDDSDEAELIEDDEPGVGNPEEDEDGDEGVLLVDEDLPVEAGVKREEAPVASGVEEDVRVEDCIKSEEDASFEEHGDEVVIEGAHDGSGALVIDEEAGAAEGGESLWDSTGTGVLFGAEAMYEDARARNEEDELRSRNWRNGWGQEVICMGWCPGQAFYPEGAVCACAVPLRFLDCPRGCEVCPDVKRQTTGWMFRHHRAVHGLSGVQANRRVRDAVVMASRNVTFVGGPLVSCPLMMCRVKRWSAQEIWRHVMHEHDDDTRSLPPAYSKSELPRQTAVSLALWDMRSGGGREGRVRRVTATLSVNRYGDRGWYTVGTSLNRSAIGSVEQACELQFAMSEPPEYCTVETYNWLRRSVT